MPTWLAVPPLIVAIAFAARWLASGDSEGPPRAGAQAAQAASASEPPGPAESNQDPGSTSAGERTDQAGRASAASESNPAATADGWAIDVVDSAGRAVAYAEIEIWDAASQRVTFQVSHAGSITGITHDAEGRAGAGWHVTVRVPGRRVDVPWSLPANCDRMRVNIGDMGRLRIACDGAEADVRVTDNQRDGNRCVVNVLGSSNPVEIPVAAGALPFALTARTRGWNASERVVGPNGQGDVVDVRLDLLGVLVTGRLVGEEMEDLPITAHLSGTFSGSTFGLEVGPDGTFAVEVPRGHATTISFQCFDDCATRDVPALVAGPYDLGRIDMVRRGRLGTLMVRDPEGAVSLEEPRVVRVTMLDGREGWPALVRFRTGREGGLDLLAAAGVASTIVAPESKDCFCEPANITIHGGGIFQAQLFAGSRIFVRVFEPGHLCWREIQLRNTATNERCAHNQGNSHVDEATNSSVHELRGVPPGSYEVVAEDVEIVGSSFVVLPGSEQQITVSVRPR